MPGLTELLRLYDERNRSRSRGGLHAISGMAFQIHCYLADYVAILAERNPEEAAEGREDNDRRPEQAPGHPGDSGARPDPDFANFESLSDYLIKRSPVDYTREGDTVVCVQAKRTLNRETLSQAADEFVAIDRFLEAHAPELRPSVRFEVIASRGQATSAACWQGVTPSRHALAQDREAQARLDAMHREGRLLPPRIDPGPWWRLLGTVFHRLSDPFGFAYEATALCLERGLHPGGAERLRVDIARLFARLRRDGRQATGRVMRACDFRPLEQQSKAVNVGQIPTVHHLQDRRFMERGEQLAAAVGSLDKVLDLRRVAPDPAVHCLWLGGASGSGKSVLLLHLMRELVVEREERVIWLGDASWNLLPFLESWRGKRTPHRESEPVFVFVDDFYAPVKRGEVALARVGNLVRHSGVADWPVLVTCGPSEQQRALESCEGGCGLSFEVWKLPLATSEERGRIQAWFAGRTGQEPKEASSSSDSPGLMVSMVFEMAKGDLREFALRFKGRLEAEQLARAVLPVLALNRLYLEAPGGCLSEEQREALDRVNQDRDFLVVTGGGTERLRLTHPHLSDEIYRVMRAGDSPSACVKDLVDGFKVALREDPGVALSVLGLAVYAHEGRRESERRERLALLPEDKLVVELAKAWAADPGTRERFGSEEKAWAWTLWAQLGQFHPEVASHMREAPALALAALREMPGHTDWPSMWFRLLDVCDGGASGLSLSTLLRLGFERLRHREVLDEDWNRVRIWKELLERGHDLGDAGISVRDLLHQGHDWLKGHEDSDSWHVVWQTLLTHDDLAEAGLSIRNLLHQGHDWLKGHEDSIWWNAVWRNLLSRDNLAEASLSLRDLLHQGHDWLKGHEDSYWWYVVWRTILSHRDLAEAGLSVRDLLHQGHDWLKGRDGSHSWLSVWRTLLGRDDLAEADLSACDLLHQGPDWLKGHEDSPRWVDVWQTLLNHDDLADAGLSIRNLLHQGHDWLKGHEDSDSWLGAWRTLLSRNDLAEAGLSARDLLHQGHDWLKGHKDSFWWHVVWRILLSPRGLAEAGLSVRDLLHQGHVWLKGHEGSRSGLSVWQTLLGRDDLAEGSLSLRDLLHQGHDWLKGHEGSYSWLGIWLTLLSHRDLAEAGLSVRDLLHQGHDWLMGHKDSSGWTKVWRTLLSRNDLAEAGLSARDLLHQGHDWLKGHEDSPRWVDVWRTLLSPRGLAEADLSVRDLLHQGHDWLARHKSENSAGWVLIGLLDHQTKLSTGASLRDLTRLGIQWLTLDYVGANEDHLGSWPTLWLALLPHLSSNPVGLSALTVLGRHWLANRSQGNPGRPAVEAALGACRV